MAVYAKWTVHCDPLHILHLAWYRVVCDVFNNDVQVYFASTFNFETAVQAAIDVTRSVS